jgi:hypothetical protein
MDGQSNCTRIEQAGETVLQQFAAETLGLVVGEAFHRAGQPIQAAVAWLVQRGR